MSTSFDFKALMGSLPVILVGVEFRVFIIYGNLVTQTRDRSLVIISCAY